MALRWLGAVFVVLAGLALCLLRAGDRQREDGLPAAPSPTLAPPALTPASRAALSSTRLSSRAIALAALTEAARTTFVSLDAEGGAEALAGPFVVDGHTIVLRAGVLAYRVLPGLDPTQNYIEVRELARGSGWQVRAEDGNAIFGFALDPQGARLIYLEADARAVGSRVPWWVVSVDLATGAKGIVLDGAQTGLAGLLPLDGSSEMILFRGITPFTDQHLGLWTIASDGSSLRPILAEADYVGLPRLSPEGDRLALLASDPSALPIARGNAGAGEPPANAIQILDLRRGELRLVSPPSPQRDLASLEWTTNGLIAVAGEWDADRNAFLHRSIVEFQPDSETTPGVLYSTEDGEITRLTPCPDDGWLAVIRFGDRTQIIYAGQAEPAAEFVGPALDWLACLPHGAGQ